MPDASTAECQTPAEVVDASGTEFLTLRSRGPQGQSPCLRDRRVPAFTLLDRRGPSDDGATPKSHHASPGAHGATRRDHAPTPGGHAPTPRGHPDASIAAPLTSRSQSPLHLDRKVPDPRRVPDFSITKPLTPRSQWPLTSRSQRKFLALTFLDRRGARHQGTSPRGHGETSRHRGATPRHHAPTPRCHAPTPRCHGAVPGCHLDASIAATLTSRSQSP